MNTINHVPLGIGRRGLLKAMTLLGIGAATFGLLQAVKPSEGKNSKFVVINGWVLPAQYFGRH